MVGDDGVHAKDTAAAQSQAEAPGSDVVHASKKPVPQEPEEGRSEEEKEEEEEEDWTEHMGEADALHDHAEGSAWAVMWLAGQDALDMEAASDAEVARGISQVRTQHCMIHHLLASGSYQMQALSDGRYL